MMAKMGKRKKIEKQSNTVRKESQHQFGTDGGKLHAEKELIRERARLGTLHEIFTESSLSVNQQIQHALLEGVNMLDLEIGIVSRVVGNTYTILNFVAEQAPLAKGQTFDLGNTYCALTLEADDVIAIDDMRLSEYSGHPCYAAFKLESYIGVPLFVDGKPYGTLNFSSTSPTDRKFSESDKVLIRLMGRWVSTVLDRQIKENELDNYRQHLEELVAQRTSELYQTNENLRAEIKERKQAEHELYEQKNFLGTLLDTIANPVFYQDLTGKYLGCNRAFEDFTNMPRHKIIGKTVHELYPKDIAETFFKKDQELYDKPGKQQYECKVKRNDGKSREIIYEKDVLRDPDSNVVGIIGVMSDITDRKEMEAHLRRSHKLEAIGTLSAGIAHDFNNILSAVIGYADIAKTKLPENSDAADDIDIVLKAGFRASDLVKQILTFSRESEQDFRPMKIDPIIKEVSKLLRASLPSTIDIRMMTETEATVFADPTQIHQVIMNLGTNAGHAMRDNGGILDIKLSRMELDAEFTVRYPELQAGLYMRLTVSDSGIGIPPDVLDRMFDPFFTTKEKGEGTGMGLSVVHGIVKSHGGAINVYSELGKGSVFNIFLPAIERRTATAKRPEKVLSRGTERVLFVDDEELLVQLGEKLLGMLGYSVTGMKNSIQALALFKKNPDQFDIVITDLTMPGLTGDQLAKELLTIKPGIPIIICTGFSSIIDEKRAKSKGISGFVNKPIIKHQLSEMVRKALDRSKK